MTVHYFQNKIRGLFILSSEQKKKTGRICFVVDEENTLNLVSKLKSSSFKINQYIVIVKLKIFIIHDLFYDI